MARRVLVALCFGFMTLILASCGQTYELQSITISPSQPKIDGISTPLAVTVTANYSNGKSEDATTKAAYQISSSDPTNVPLAGLSVNKSGILSTTTVPVCTWSWTLNSDGSTYTYALVSPYTLTATYSGFTATAVVGVASAVPCYDGSSGNTAPVPKS
jgi:hypothetical protein